MMNVPFALVWPLFKGKYYLPYSAYVHLDYCPIMQHNLSTVKINSNHIPGT